MRRSHQMGLHERPDGALSYDRHVREWVVRVGPLRIGVGYYRYTTERGRPSRRRELSMSVSWLGRPLPRSGFPVDTHRNGGQKHA